MIYKNKHGKWCRVCPHCKKKIISNSNRWNVINSDLKNRVCLSCRRKGKIFLIYNKEPYKTINNKWAKKCFKCNNEIIFNKRSSALESIRNKRKCKKCANAEMIISPKNIFFDTIKRKWYNECVNCKNKKYYSSKGNSVMNKNTECRRCSVINGKHNIGNKLSSSARESIRIKLLNRIKSNYGSVSFNSKACQFIDKLNKERGLNLQHALNGGEIEISGYSLDGYDKGRNIIFEYDEPRHNSTHHKQKDLVRQNILINKLNPSQFIRYDERNNKLYDVITNKDISCKNTV